MKTTYNYIAALSFLILSGCSSSSTIPTSERNEYRNKIDVSTKSAVDELVKQRPELASKIESSAGYFSVEVSGAKLPVVGKAQGIGSLYSKSDDSTTYMDVERYDLGVGLGVSSYKVVTFFDDQKSISNFDQGGWGRSLAVEYRFKDTNIMSVNDVSINGKEVPAYVIAKSGTNLSSSVIGLKVTRNQELTDTGTSNVNLPVKGYPATGKQSESAPRNWDRVLPFFGQKVVDLGYDLPLPIGISFVYAHTNQEMELGALEVGKDANSKQPINFVSFSDNKNTTSTPQIKVDAWLFPFMNIYGSFGKISGDANVNFALNGDDLLEQMGVDCSGKFKPPSCSALEGKETVPFEVNVDLDGYSYSVGTVLAGGWNGYFLAVPFTFSYADMKGSDTDGIVFSSIPRAGKIFHFDNDRSLALYAGASYLDSDLKIAGQQPVPGTELVIDYTIGQRNIDKWEGLVGGNYSFDEYYSLSFEYVGFGGGRSQYIGGLSRRF